jgi:hypothetical protein
MLFTLSRKRLSVVRCSIQLSYGRKIFLAQRRPGRPLLYSIRATVKRPKTHPNGAAAVAANDRDRRREGAREAHH